MDIPYRGKGDRDRGGGFTGGKLKILMTGGAGAAIGRFEPEPVASGTLDISESGLIVAIEKFLTAVGYECEFVDEFVGVPPDHTEDIDQVAINIVDHLRFYGIFSEQDIKSAAENFDVTLVVREQFYETLGNFMLAAYIGEYAFHENVRI